MLVAGDEHVDLPAALDELAGRGLARVLCEGGPTLLADLVASGRLDELCLTVAPQLVGGDGPRILAGPELDVRFSLGHLLEDDGVLFTRYVAAELCWQPRVRSPAAGSPPCAGAPRRPGPRVSSFVVLMLTAPLLLIAMATAAAASSSGASTMANTSVSPNAK